MRNVQKRRIRGNNNKVIQLHRNLQSFVRAWPGYGVLEGVGVEANMLLRHSAAQGFARVAKRRRPQLLPLVEKLVRN